jgi:hypothetical protein
VDYERAKRVLELHSSGTDEDGNEPAGFIGSLRPYRELVERNFHILMQALFVVGDTMCRSELVERKLVHAIWDICLVARLYGLEPDGMLQRNHLITPEDVRRLRAQVWTLETTALSFLWSNSPIDNVEGYAQYVIDFGPWDNAEFFLPLLQAVVADPDSFDPSVAALALGKMGRRAQSTLPDLRRALQREYPHYLDPNLSTAEVRAEIARAIAQIEADL